MKRKELLLLHAETAYLDSRGGHILIEAISSLFASMVLEQHYTNSGPGLTNMKFNHHSTRTNGIGVPTSSFIFIAVVPINDLATGT